jgi:hypothetical protein
VSGAREATQAAPANHAAEGRAEGPRIGGRAQGARGATRRGARMAARRGAEGATSREEPCRQGARSEGKGRKRKRERGRGELTSGIQIRR